MNKIVEWFTVDTNKIECEIGQTFLRVHKVPNLNLTPGKFMSGEKMRNEALPIYHFVDFNGKDRYVAVDLETLQFLEPAYKDYFGGKVKQLEQKYDYLKHKLDQESDSLRVAKDTVWVRTDERDHFAQRIVRFKDKNVFQRIISAIKGEI